MVSKKKVACARPRNTRNDRSTPKTRRSASSGTKRLVTRFKEKLASDLLLAEKSTVEAFCQSDLRASIQAILEPFLNDYKEGYFPRSDYGFVLRHEATRAAGSLPRVRDARGHRLSWRVVAYGNIDPGASVPDRCCPLDDRHYIENWEGNWAADPKSALLDFVENAFPGLCESLTSEAFNRRDDRNRARDRQGDDT